MSLGRDFGRTGALCLPRVVGVVGVGRCMGYMATNVIYSLVCNGMYTRSAFSLSSRHSRGRSMRTIPKGGMSRGKLVLGPRPRQVIAVTKGAYSLSRNVGLGSGRSVFTNGLSFLSPGGGKIGLAVSFKRGITDGTGMGTISNTCTLIIGRGKVAVAKFSRHNTFCNVRALGRLIRDPISSNDALPFLRVGSCPSLPGHKMIRNFCNAP